MGLFSAWNICCIFSMLILVDHKQVTPLFSFKQKNSTEFSDSCHKVFWISGCSCTLPWCLSNLSTSLLRCGLKNGTELSPWLPCAVVHRNKSRSWFLLCMFRTFCTAASLEEMTFTWLLTVTPPHIAPAPLWCKRWSPFPRELCPPSTVMKGQPWAQGRKWLSWSLDHLAEDQPQVYVRASRETPQLQQHKKDGAGSKGGACIPQSKRRLLVYSSPPFLWNVSQEMVREQRQGMNKTHIISALHESCRERWQAPSSSPPFLVPHLPQWLSQLWLGVTLWLGILLAILCRSLLGDTGDVGSLLRGAHCSAAAYWYPS